MCIFDKEDIISKQYLKDIGFKTYYDHNWTWFAELTFISEDRYIKLCHHLVYTPSDNICKLRFAYIDNSHRRKSGIQIYPFPTTQMDMDIIIKECKEYISSITKIPLKNINIFK